MRGVNHTKEEYKIAMKLLRKYKSPAKVGRILHIPRTTVRNWKLNYSYPPGFSKRISEKDILQKIEFLGLQGKKVPEIANELGISYNSALSILKRNFKILYETKLKKKFHRLNEYQKSMTPELAYILGVMFGDGYTYGRVRANVVGLGVIDKDFRDIFASILEKWSGKRPYIVEYPKRGRLYYTCLLYSTSAGEFLANYKKLGNIPDDILDGTNEVKIMFIKGFADSEGSGQLYRITITNKNIKLLNGIKAMLVSLGFDGTKLQVKNHTKFGVYGLNISGKSNVNLYKVLIGFSIKRKQEKIIKATTGIRTQPEG